MENPFEFGRELGANELVNRTEELSLIRETVESSGKLFVIGPRRFGKTSLLKAFTETSVTDGNLILRYNAESFPDFSSLVRKIIEDSAKSLQGKIEKTGAQVKRYFKSLRPEISFSLTQNEWKASFGVLPASPNNQIELVVDALNGLELLAAEQNKKVALIIDEFQEILAQTGIAAEKQIRSAIQTHQNMAYIFAGSKTKMLTEMTTDASRPFYRLGKLMFVGTIPRPEFSRFLIDKFMLGNFFAPKTEESGKAALALQIIEAAEDVPYNVQMLAHTLWNRLSQSIATENAFLNQDLIAETLEKLVRQTDPFYTQIWNKLTAIQKKTLTATVAQRGLNLLSQEVTQSINVSPSSIRRALESLAEQDILRTVESGGKIQYRFEDPFFAQWIRLFTF